MGEVRKNDEAIYELTRAKLGGLVSTSMMSSADFITARRWAALRYHVDVMTEPVEDFVLGLKDRELYSAQQASRLLAATILCPKGVTRKELLAVNDDAHTLSYAVGNVVLDARRAGVVYTTKDSDPRVIATPALLLTVLDDFPRRAGRVGEVLGQDPHFALEGLWDRFTEPEFSPEEVTDFKFALDRTPLS